MKASTTERALPRRAAGVRSQAMATLTAAPARRASQKKREIPPLENGDRLTSIEFLRRYEAMPHIKKAELIEGIVYMGSPVRADARRPAA